MKKEPKHIRTMDIILVVVATALLVFTITMIQLFKDQDSEGAQQGEKVGGRRPNTRRGARGRIDGTAKPTGGTKC